MFQKIQKIFNPKLGWLGGGEGVLWAHSEIARQFLQDYFRLLELLDFFKFSNDVGTRVKESFWDYLDWLSRKRTQFNKNLHIFWGKNHKLQFLQKFW